MLFVAAVFVVLFVSVTLARRDAWPFTRYPMFSRYRDPWEVRVICFGLETLKGNVTWWRPRFYRYQDTLGRKLAPDDSAHRLWVVSEVLRLVRLEEGDARRYIAVHIVERRWVDCAVRDRTLARIAVSGETHVI